MDKRKNKVPIEKLKGPLKSFLIRYIDPDVHAKFKTACFTEGRTMSEAIISFMKAFAEKR